MIIATLLYQSRVRILRAVRVVQERRTITSTNHVAIRPTLVVTARRAVRVRFQRMNVLLLLRRRVLSSTLLGTSGPQNRKIRRGIRQLMFGIKRYNSKRVNCRVQERARSTTSLHREGLLHFGRLAILQ